MDSVKETFGLQCPGCGSDERLVVVATVCVDLLPEGVEQNRYSSYEWDDDSPISCDNCGWEGTVEEAEV